MACPGKLFDVNDFATLAVRNMQAAILHLTSLLTEDRAQEPLLGRQLGLTLGGNLADENVAWFSLGANSDDPVLIEIV